MLFSSYMLMSNESAVELAKTVNMESQLLTQPFCAKLQFSRTEEQVNHHLKDSEYLDTTVDMLIRASCTPNIMKLGPYTTINEEVLKTLNFDYRFAPEKLELIPKLFRGAIIYDEVCILVLTCEVYSRAATLNAHCEATPISVPTNQNDIICSTFSCTDGGKLLRKLIIGKHAVNLLVTSCMEVGKEVVVHAGPGVELENGSVNASSSKIFICEKESQALVENFSCYNVDQSQKNLCNLRQLTTGFHLLSTYGFMRSTLQELNNPLYMPATIFTLCDLPTENGYGFSNTSLAKIESSILQIFSIAVIQNNAIVTMEKFKNIYTEYGTILQEKKDVKAWAPVISVSDGIKTAFSNGNLEVNVIDFCRKNNNVTLLAQDLSSTIATANKTIKNNIKSKIIDMYR